MATQMIRRTNDRLVPATYVRHLRTLTGPHSGSDNRDVDLYRLEDGTEVRCISPSGDARKRPRECDMSVGHYPGYAPGV